MFIYSANAEYFNASTLFEDYIANGFQYKPRNPSDARDDTKKYDKHGNPNNRYRFVSFDTRNDNIEVSGDKRRNCTKMYIVQLYAYLMRLWNANVRVDTA